MGERTLIVMTPEQKLQNFWNGMYLTSDTSPMPGGVRRRFWGCGFIVVICIIIVVLLAVYIPQEPFKNVNSMQEAFDNVTRLYTDFVSSMGNPRVNQPLVFPTQLNSFPANCVPYAGCFYPSWLSNPVSLKSGVRENAQYQDEIWCEKGWRDCNAYQDCVEGVCRPKNGMYPRQL